MAVIDTKTINDFKMNLFTFNRAMEKSNEEINELLKRPGIESESITEQLLNLQTKLNNLSKEWEHVSSQMVKHIEETEEAARQAQKNMENVLTTE